MTTARLTILYEDQRAEAHSFGLHTLVSACVFDAIDGDRYKVEDALSNPRPLKGVQKVLRACRDDFNSIAKDGRDVIAVIDNDAIRHHLRLPRDATRARVEQEIRKGCPAPERLHVVLIVENTESAIEAVAACNPGIDPKRVDAAVQRKSLLARDAILTEMSIERERAVRDCVLGRMPSLRGLVELLAGKLLPGSAKPAAAPSAAASPRKKAKPAER